MKRKANGFTFLEIMVAVAMGMVLTVIAVPMVAATLSSINLRMTAFELSSGLQYARMHAVDIDTNSAVRISTTGGRTFVYIDQNNNGVMDAGDDKNLLVLPRQIAFDTNGPSLGLTGTTAIGLPGFTPRGLPCTPGINTCASASGTTYYVFLRQTRVFGAPGWAAITVSPAARIQVLTWNGASWN